MILSQCIALLLSRNRLCLCYRTLNNDELSWSSAWRKHRCLQHFHQRSWTRLCKALELTHLPQMVLVPPYFLSILSQGQPLALWSPLDSISISGELSTWATPQILHLIWASTDQLEQRITTVEHTNQALTQQKNLCERLSMKPLQPKKLSRTCGYRLNPLLQSSPTSFLKSGLLSTRSFLSFQKISL
jgi:hypothetical protein